MWYDVIAYSSLLWFTKDIVIVIKLQLVGMVTGAQPTTFQHLETIIVVVIK